MFGRGVDLKLSFADADYAKRCSDRRLFSGVAVVLGITAVFAGRTIQYCLALSTSEVEYVV